MEKIQPSKKISKEIHELIQNGCDKSDDLLTLLIQKSVKKIIQETLEQEINDYLGRDYFQRNQYSRKGYRNGYEPKTLKTAEGAIDIDVPQLRNTETTYRSRLLKQMNHRTSELERLATEMYVRGLSTRDIEDTFTDDNGTCLMSKDGVSQVTESLNDEYNRFCQRDLSVYDVVYLFVDGVYERMRLTMGSHEAILCAWGILSDGRKMLFHISLGNKESYLSWNDFFRSMISRGLRMPLLIVSDGAPGLIKAINECFPKSKRQRCIIHKLRNIATKLPKAVVKEMMPLFKNVYYQANKKLAMMLATDLIETYADDYPAAIKCFQEDLDACLQHIDFPVGHHRYIRTTNLIERCFVEQKRRTKVIPRFLNEKSCLKLVYATLIRVSARWNRISMSELDLTLLRKMRALYEPKNEDDRFISLTIAA